MVVSKLLVLEKLLILSPQQSHNVCGKLRYLSRLLQVAVYVLIFAENMGVIWGLHNVWVKVDFFVSVLMERLNVAGALRAVQMLKMGGLCLEKRY